VALTPKGPADASPNPDAAAAAAELDPYRARLYHTMGVHPTCSDEFFSDDADGPQGHLAKLREAVGAGVAAGKCIAIGEAGLDYARLHFASKERQLDGFALQLGLAEETKLPMFLHNRDTEGDFERIMRENRGRIRGGVVHSFTGSLAEARALVDLDLYIGVNGCSLKTEENLEVVRWLPTERIMLETDAPWCGIRASHAGHGHVATTWPAKANKKHSPEFTVKGRCEPCHMTQVLEVVCAVRGEADPVAFRDAVTRNTVDLFFPPESEG